LLRTLGRSLAESIESDAAPHQRPAREHGEQRWEVGWALPEVVRDYQILRLVVFEHLEAVLDRPLHFREIMAIGLVFDEAISASVASYARQRETSLPNRPMPCRSPTSARTSSWPFSPTSCATRWPRS
jgi:hypothetical protein